MYVLRGFYVAKKLSFIFAFYKCEYSLIEFYLTRSHLIELSFTNEIIITILTKLNTGVEGATLIVCFQKN